MEINNMPFCCTTAVLGMFGEHGEKSVVTAQEVQRLIDSKRAARRDKKGELIENGKKLILATSTNPTTIRLLTRMGFRILDHYPGVQGEVFVMSFHVDL